MIELDPDGEYFKKFFGRYKVAPTHAEIVDLSWSIPHNYPEHEKIANLRPHIEAIYAYGRLDENGDFTITEDDAMFQQVKTAVDMTIHDTEPHRGTKGIVTDTPEMTARRERGKQANAIRESLLAHREGPHPDDPTKRVPSRHRRNRFGETDIDIVFSHTDNRLFGKAVID